VGHRRSGLRNFLSGIFQHSFSPQKSICKRLRCFNLIVKEGVGFVNMPNDVSAGRNFAFLPKSSGKPD
jgi:hypothetical protein